MRRKAITDKMKLESLLRYSGNICWYCGGALQWGDEIEWDHQKPLALGGKHSGENVRALHKACHAKKTFGSAATSAGSDIHAIAKVKRLRNPKPSKHPMRRIKGQKYKWPKRSFPKRSFRS